MAEMATLPRKETERRLKLMAKTLVDMENGLYQWPDGRKPTRPDGSPVVSKAELIRVAGYKDTHSGRAYAAWFNDPYFKRQYALEKARREAAIPAIRDEGPINLLLLGRRMVDELLLRLKHDPDSVSSSQLLQFAPQFIDKGLEIEARGRASDGTTNNIDQLNAVMGNLVVNMNADEREKFVTTAQDASAKRMQLIKGTIDAIEAREEDDDLDVIDGALSAESS